MMTPIAVILRKSAFITLSLIFLGVFLGKKQCFGTESLTVGNSIFVSKEINNFIKLRNKHSFYGLASYYNTPKLFFSQQKAD